LENTGPQPVPQAQALILSEAQKILNEDKDICRRIGQNGLQLIPDHATLITHCNAGALATAGEGTALGIIYAAAALGKILHVYADETRPLFQGARLTAWELAQHGIPVSVLCDNMAATILRDKKVSAAVVGADRIAANGDVANKIGTFGLAILCRYFQVPFYVAAPGNTVDFACLDGSAIPIEMRSEIEIRELGDRKIVPDSCAVYNPAFDVTPAELVSAIITEKGIHRPPFQGSLRGLK
jgi:methylthioribose-1-phosphate isomerase